MKQDSNKTLKQHLQVLQGVKRRAHHPLVHELHEKFRISRKTLFYIKEYGPHSHVAQTIIRESLKILILASIVSSFGGLALEHIKLVFVSIIPLTILLPTLNDMIGDYGTIISSHLSTMLHEEKIKVGDYFHPELRAMVTKILIISIITGLLSAAAALGIASFSKISLTADVVYKIFFITIVDVVLLINVLALISTATGFYFFKKNEDPNNFLIPITTSIADFGNMIVLALLVRLLF